MSQSTSSKKGKKGSNALFYIFLVAFIICLAVIGVKLWAAYREQQSYSKLAQMVNMQPQPAGNQSQTAQHKPTEESFAQNLQQLKEMNPDFYGWISIQDTRISYPVVYTPENPAHYLRRDFEGKYAMAGVPFLGDGCTPDGDHFIIHGHNMKNGTMFADLMNYEDEQYCKDHPYIQFDTPSAQGKYEVVAAFFYDVTEGAESLPLYAYSGKLNAKQFGKVMKFVHQKALYNTGVMTEYGDTLLTLSTCTNQRENDRFIVVARKEGTNPYVEENP